MPENEENLKSTADRQTAADGSADEKNESDQTVLRQAADSERVEEPERKGPSGRGLGRGLDAIFGGPGSFLPKADAETKSGLAVASIADLVPALNQPRKHFDKEALNNLANSLRTDGLIQPILVRPVGDNRTNAKYEIIAGERRWRAAQLAGLHDVPVQIRNSDDHEAMRITLIENLQREDLNAVETAEGFQSLMQDFGLTQEQLAESVGVSRPQITNTLRLLKLPERVKKLIVDKELSAGHARCLVGMEDSVALRLAKEAIEKKMGVREFEKYAKKRPGGKKTKITEKSPEIASLEHALSNALGMRVDIVSDAPHGERGKVIIAYSKLDQFDALISRLVDVDGF